MAQLMIVNPSHHKVVLEVSTLLPFCTFFADEDSSNANLQNGWVFAFLLRQVPSVNAECVVDTLDATYSYLMGLIILLVTMDSFWYRSRSE